MKKEYSVTKEVTFTVIIWSCDHPGCDKSVSTNKGCCGGAPIMECEFCGKHVCSSHRRFADGTGDYIIAVSCLDKNCLEKLDEKESAYWGDDNDEE